MPNRTSPKRPRSTDGCVATKDAFRYVTSSRRSCANGFSPTTAQQRRQQRRCCEMNEMRAAVAWLLEGNPSGKLGSHKRGLLKWMLQEHPTALTSKQLFKLRKAALTGDDYKTLETLVREGAYTKHQMNHEPLDGEMSTALHVAASKGHLGTCSALLKGCADPNVRDEFNNTPMHRAASRHSAGGSARHREVLLLLTQAGADVYATNDAGMTPYAALGLAS